MGILMTTRNVEVVECASSGKAPYHMRLMSFDESWSLLYEKVFVKDYFSLEFEQLGKTIALNCGGLPLALVLIAGLLSKIGKSLVEWKSIVKNVSSTVNTEVNVQCMRVVALSYHYLPHHLKLCFLYNAIFQEDELVLVNKLLELWAAKGFLKVEERKSIEEVAEKCLQELINRSLISIRNLSFDGKIEICGMHDVTRELCLREARDMNIVNVTREEKYQNPCVQSMHFSSKSRGRISIQAIKYEPDTEKILARYPKNDVRSIIRYRVKMFMPKLLQFKLVRVLDFALMRFSAFPSLILDLIHLRYLALSLSPSLQHYLREEISSSFSNLKKLAFYGTCLQWKNLSIVGKLPKLEALKLGISPCIGIEWKVVKDGFPSLKFLLLERLKVCYWRASCDHFPCLERLFLEHCWNLDSIPQDFADITTLALIDIRWCAESVGNSAKQIQEDVLNNYAKKGDKDQAVEQQELQLWKLFLSYFPLQFLLTDFGQLLITISSSIVISTKSCGIESMYQQPSIAYMDSIQRETKNFSETNSSRQANEDESNSSLKKDAAIGTSSEFHMVI
ncbi:late blight resistance protein R1-A-like [Nicotiana sylvestris]|uniref:late blight resistance protein R1-A-like n=1 Tax=Nicotiana sylvestris TaxID=4096 RepID=UPI00388CCC09